MATRHCHPSLPTKSAVGHKSAASACENRGPFPPRVLSAHGCLCRTLSGVDWLGHRVVVLGWHCAEHLQILGKVAARELGRLECEEKGLRLGVDPQACGSQESSLSPSATPKNRPGASRLLKSSSSCTRPTRIPVGRTPASACFRTAGALKVHLTAPVWVEAGPGHHRASHLTESTARVCPCLGVVSTPAPAWPKWGICSCLQAS